MMEKLDYNWQREDRRLEPAIILTLMLGVAVAAFLASLA